MKLLWLSLCLACTASRPVAQTVFTIDAAMPLAEVQPTMYGVFFEDINFGADGGIYAELVKNRSFEFTRPMMGWRILGTQTEGDFVVQNRKETNTNNPRFLRVRLRKNSPGPAGLNNEGFRGMGIKRGLRYDFSIAYRKAGTAVSLRLELIGSDKKVLGDTSVTLQPTTGGWSTQKANIFSRDTDEKASLNIWFEGEGELDLDMVSLFPSDTWLNRPGGMRADMIGMLAEMKPGFIRFPGGCIVEGYDLSQRYQWKKTIGPVEERQLLINRWNFEFAHRPAPDYFQTFGLGFFEYFQLAEDIGAEPLPILNCGMACQFNSAEVVELHQIGPYIQDALDLIEFANGSPETRWGKVRADLGHAAPFNLKMIGIGNENWGPQYIERFRLFYQAIKEKYPSIKLIGSAGTDPGGDRYEYLNRELRAIGADIIDEHYYRRPEWFLQNARRYDSFPRNGSKIFAGEYAAQSDRTVSISNRNNWQTALAEAAFLTGLERNADLVVMASYAPLFAHVEGWQWTPDLIWVDNLRVSGTPNYYVQKLFSLHKGTHTVSILNNRDVIAGQDSIYASAVVDKRANELIVKLVNVSSLERSVQLDVKGLRRMPRQARLTILQSTELDAVNTVENGSPLQPVEKEVGIKGQKTGITLQPYSFTLFRVKLS